MEGTAKIPAEQARKRLFISARTGAREREKTIKLAIENECNTLVFSLNDIVFSGKKNLKYMKLAKKYEINIEAGGYDLPLLLPKRLFMFNRELFRMFQGKRKNDHHFCPTNPRTTGIIAENARILISRAVQTVTQPRIFHLLPDKGFENIWCQCPACRAFRPYEQYLMAVNTAADIIAEYDKKARLVYIDLDTEPEAEGVRPRKNAIVLGK